MAVTQFELRFVIVSRPTQLKSSVEMQGLRSPEQKGSFHDCGWASIIATSPAGDRDVIGTA